MTPEEFRKHGHSIIDWIADYRSSLEDHPVMAQLAPGEVTSRLTEAPPEVGEDPAKVIADLDDVVVPGLSLWQHPSFFNFFPSNSELSSVLGDIVASGLGVIGLSWESSPVLSEMEQRCMDWLRVGFGLSDNWRGVIQDTASTSTLLAMLEARERATDISMARGGMDQGTDTAVVYCTRYAHSSVPKAVMLAGFGEENIHYVDTTETFAMSPEALVAAVEEDLAAGKVPAAVVGTCGTTTTTALDPLRKIGEVAREHEMWFHVDAALAGSVMLLPECRWMWDGVELADSLVINAHKWLGVAFECSLYFVQDPAHLERVMSTNPSYLSSDHDDDVTNLRDWGIPLGRRFRSLKIWFMLRMEGMESIRARLRRDLDNAQWFAQTLSEADDWEILAPVHLQTVCIRHVPKTADGTTLSHEQLDAHTRAWAQRVNESGDAWISLSQLEGRWMVRVSIGALGTERHHVEKLWAQLQESVLDV
jgi:glutamate/tyrosine decarboxylase-like PLP-dependent enzyme